MNWIIAAGIAALIVAGAALAVRNFKTAQSIYDRIIDLGDADDLDASIARHPAGKLTVVPDGFTCLGCRETDALPDSIWCAVCGERVANFPAEPIERGRLQ